MKDGGPPILDAVVIVSRFVVEHRRYSPGFYPHGPHRRRELPPKQDCLIDGIPDNPNIQTDDGPGLNRWMRLQMERIMDGFLPLINFHFSSVFCNKTIVNHPSQICYESN